MNAPATTIKGSDMPSVARPFRLQFEKAQDAWVLLYPEGMVKLNQSAGEILKRCNGERSVADIVTELEEDFRQSDLERDVHDFLAIALKQRWISFSPAASDASEADDNV